MNNTIYGGSYGKIDYKIDKLNGEYVKFGLYVDGHQIARFDTEDKARLFTEGFTEGLRVYSEFK